MRFRWLPMFICLVGAALESNCLTTDENCVLKNVVKFTRKTEKCLKITVYIPFDRETHTNPKPLNLMISDFHLSVAPPQVVPPSQDKSVFVTHDKLKIGWNDLFLEFVSINNSYLNISLKDTNDNDIYSGEFEEKSSFEITASGLSVVFNCSKEFKDMEMDISILNTVPLVFEEGETSVIFHSKWNTLNLGFTLGRRLFALCKKIDDGLPEIRDLAEASHSSKFSHELNKGISNEIILKLPMFDVEEYTPIGALSFANLTIINFGQKAYTVRVRSPLSQKDHIWKEGTDTNTTLVLGIFLGISVLGSCVLIFLYIMEMRKREDLKHAKEELENSRNKAGPSAVSIGSLCAAHMNAPGNVIENPDTESIYELQNEFYQPFETRKN